MSRILESFSDNAPSYGGDLALQETYTVLKEIYDVPDSLFHKRMDFLNEVLDLKEFIEGSCADSFTRSTDAGGYCGFLASQSQSSLFR